MEDAATVANTEQIKADLEYMTRRWRELPEQVVFEVRAFKEGVPAPKVAKYKPDEIDDAVDWIEALNDLGHNVYVVRNPIRYGTSGSATDADIVAAFFLWADCDDTGATDNVRRFEGPKYSAAVTTGRTPDPRVHIYWELAEPCTDMAAWRDMQRSIASHLGSDGSVINPSRIMRIGGTVAYPSTKKQERGYVKEVATIRTQYAEPRHPVTLDQMARVFGQARPEAPMQIDTASHASLDRERMKIQALSGKDWHDAVIRLVGSYVSKGLSDDEIHGLTAPLTLSGYTVEQTRQEVQTAIDGARAKGWAPPPQIIDEIAEKGEDPNWAGGLIRNSRGRPYFNTANAQLVLQNAEDVKDCFAYDEFRQLKIVTKPLPGSHARKSDFKGRDYRDSDLTMLLSWFNRNGFPDASKTTLADVVDAVAEESMFHPVRNYLEALPPWDGEARAACWLERYCQVAPATEDMTHYVREVGLRWLISAVARVMQPGCKADGVLILEGKQGAMKSTTLRTLCGEDWFGDSLPGMHTKDASDYLRGKWIIEMAELSNINKAEVEIVKAFISRAEERFRPAYGRTEITYHRQCVFAGSTNKSDYLRDETGNRRFWPVAVGDRCDNVAIALERDQIWAEALQAYRNGQEWWLNPNVVREAEKQQEQRVAQDAWEGEILQFLVGRGEVSTTEIAKTALSLEVARIDRAASNRITAILAKAGYVRRGQFTNGESKGRAKYVKD